MLDIQGEEATGLQAFVAENAPDATLELQPMLSEPDHRAQRRPRRGRRRRP